MTIEIIAAIVILNCFIFNSVYNWCVNSKKNDDNIIIIPEYINNDVKVEYDSDLLPSYSEVIKN
mgnify:CR=1 FL=1|tara:strand:- start:436 stop:627 length:192 start_codon:yes stop_codon:yes gene_type:complete